MISLSSLTEQIQTLSIRLFNPLARTALFVIFFLFGFLKIIGLSPADDLAHNFTIHMGFGPYFDILFMGLAVVECIIGLLFLFPRFTVLASVLMMAHLVFVSSPIILFTSGTWESFMVPNLSGQYIIKNLALVALALGLIASTAAAKTPSRKGGK